MTISKGKREVYRKTSLPGGEKITTHTPVTIQEMPVITKTARPLPLGMGLLASTTTTGVMVVNGVLGTLLTTGNTTPAGRISKLTLITPINNATQRILFMCLLMS